MAPVFGMIGDRYGHKLNFMLKISYRVFPIFLAVISISGCGEKSYKETKLLMDTVCEITVISPDKTPAQISIDKAFKEIERIDSLCGYGKNSQVSQINKNAGIKPVVVDKELFNLIEESIKISDLTGGAFDITVGPLGSLWGFNNSNLRLPASGEIKKVLPLVNYKNVIINKDKSTVFLLKPGMKIDLGGIAKKYSLRMVIKKLKENGIKKAMVNLGGDIQVMGGAFKGRPWKIGLQHPRKPGELVTVFRFNDKTIISSGDYERCFFVNGVRYHHIFDPRTGNPAKGIISATILTDGPIAADAMATAVFALGVKRGLEIIKTIPDTEALIISETNKGTVVTLTDGLKKMKLEYNY